MDESFDDGGFFVVAGYISTAERWSHFSLEWKSSLPLAVQNKDGNFHFKMAQMAHPDRIGRVGLFHEIIQRNAMAGVTFTLDQRDLHSALNRLSIDHIETILWESGLNPYVISVRMFMETFHRLRAEKQFIRDLFGDEPIDFYFDENSQKKWLLCVWDEFLNSLTPRERALYGATPRFERDEEFLPIQAADFQAWWVRKWANEHGIGRIRLGNYKGFKRSETKLPQINIHVDEDIIAEFIKSQMAAGLRVAGLPESTFRIRDTKGLRIVQSGERVDPPFPFEVMLNAFKQHFRSLTRRR